MNKKLLWLASLSGRISRGSFIGWTITVVATFVVLFVFLETLFGRAATWVLYPAFFWVLFALVVRRLHDFAQSAFWMLIVLLPVFGPLLLLLLLSFRKGTQGENQYGADTLEYGANYFAVDIDIAGRQK